MCRVKRTSSVSFPRSVTSRLFYVPVWLRIAVRLLRPVVWSGAENHSLGKHVPLLLIKVNPTRLQMFVERIWLELRVCRAMRDEWMIQLLRNVQKLQSWSFYRLCGLVVDNGLEGELYRSAKVSAFHQHFELWRGHEMHQPGVKRGGEFFWW